MEPPDHRREQTAERDSWDEHGRPTYTFQEDYSVFAEDSGTSALLEKRVVAVTPLTLDMTARVDLGAFG